MSVGTSKMLAPALGMKGGYANLGLNWINQSYMQGGGTNYFSLEGKSITGLIMSGSLRYNSTLGGQILVGGSDPWFSINYSNDGLYMQGVYSRGLAKTTALSLSGIFGALYMRVPLTNSNLGNTLIENVLLAPGQKALENE